MNFKEIEKYLKSNKLEIANANAALVGCDMVFGAYSITEKAIKYKFSPIFASVSYKRPNSFYQINSSEVAGGPINKIYKDYLKNEKALAVVIAKHLKAEKDLDLFWKKYIKSKNPNNKQLLSFYKQIYKKCTFWWFYAIFGEEKGEIINYVIIKKFAKNHNLSINKATEIINILSHPKGQSVLNIERKMFLEICIDLLDGKNVDKKIKKYIEKNFWFKSDFYHANKITPESIFLEATSEIKQMSKESILAEIGKINETNILIENKKRDLLNELKLSKEDKKDIKFALKIVKWIDERKRGMMKNLYYFYYFINDVADRFGMEYSDLAVYFTDELEGLISNGERLTDKEIEKRKQGVFCVWENKNRRVFYGQEAQDLFEIATHAKTQDIIGQVASFGGVKNISGKVKIIFDPIKDRFENGDILVTSMTRVEFVPLMRKAKAIITNEGGIACHAAIVSRELGVPCIIGTKTATQMLANGDEVELDLEKGVVRIIKKK